MAEYIDRLKLLPKVETNYIEDAKRGFDYYDYLLLTDLMNAETEDVIERSKQGKWLKSNIGGAKVCSICLAHMGLSNFKYCPNCGAKMDKEDLK